MHILYHDIVLLIIGALLTAYLGRSAQVVLSAAIQDIMMSGAIGVALVALT